MKWFVSNIFYMTGSYLLIMAVLQRMFGTVGLREAALLLATFVLIRSVDVILFWKYMTRDMDISIKKEDEQE